MRLGNQTVKKKKKKTIGSAKLEFCCDLTDEIRAGREGCQEEGQSKRAEEAEES